MLIRRKTGFLSGRIRKCSAFPRPVRDHGPIRTRHVGAMQASARPGRVGAGRGIWPLAGE